MHGWKWNAKYWNALFVARQQCFPFLFITLEQLLVRSSAVAFFSFHLVGKLFYTFLIYLDIPLLRPVSSYNYMFFKYERAAAKHIAKMVRGFRVLTEKVGEHGEEDSTQNLKEGDCHML